MTIFRNKLNGKLYLLFKGVVPYNGKLYAEPYMHSEQIKKPYMKNFEKVGYR